MLEILHFLITQRFKGFAVSDDPYFGSGSTAFFMSLMRTCHRYLEYGSGGSTVAAARLNKPFISVDTDRFFLESVKKKIGKLSSAQHLVYANIGLTGPWGIPLHAKHPSSSRLKKWRAYSSMPWKLATHGNMPDLVLVDGRFRVASALTAFANLAGLSDARVLVDDYTNRPHYHVMEKHAKLIRTVEYMAVFQPPSGGGNLWEAADQYATDWR